MKKLISLIAVVCATMAFAEPPSLCTEMPWLPQCDAGQVGPQGPEGPQGPQGEKGDQGEVGPAGADGKDGKDGADGKDGVNGADGRDGVDGIDGKDGMDGKDGKDGRDGADGVNGKDADMSQVKKALDYARDSAAGNSAMASIDFGSTCKGVTVGGVGLGVAHNFDGTSTAGALGVKHGFTDETAGIVKAWNAGGGSYGAGVGVTHRF